MGSLSGCCLDVRAFDVIEVGPFDAHQLGQSLPFWRVNRIDIVEVRVARLQDVGPLRLDQRWFSFIARLNDAPISHFGIADRESINRPA